MARGVFKSRRGKHQKIGLHTWRREWVCGCELYVVTVLKNVNWKGLNDEELKLEKLVRETN